MKKITFPKVEKSDVKARLKETGKIITTRTSKDFGRFKVGERLEYAGFLLNVVKLESFENLDDHPFLDELDGKMKRYIVRHGKFEVLWLVLIGHDSGEPEVIE